MEKLSTVRSSTLSNMFGQCVGYRNTNVHTEIKKLKHWLTVYSVTISTRQSVQLKIRVCFLFIVESLMVISARDVFVFT